MRLLLLFSKCNALLLTDWMSVTETLRTFFLPGPVWLLLLRPQEFWKHRICRSVKKKHLAKYVKRGGRNCRNFQNWLQPIDKQELDLYTMITLKCRILADGSDAALAVMKKGKVMRLMIINAGIKLYLEEGFSNTTNKHICNQLDISTGQLTFYFPTKEHLLEELVKELCDFQYRFMERTVAEGYNSLFAACLELATIVAACEADPHVKDFYIATYTHPRTLKVIRQRDTARAKQIYGEYCPDWTEEDFARIQTVVSGIEYGTLMAQPEDMPVDLRIATALDSIMQLYGVPGEIRKRKIEKVLDMDYQTLGKVVLQNFKQYTERVNQQALQQELEEPGQKKRIF